MIDTLYFWIADTESTEQTVYPIIIVDGESQLLIHEFSHGPYLSC